MEIVWKVPLKLGSNGSTSAGPAEPDHLVFLKKIADFGHGVFTRTMFHSDVRQRKALQNWCLTHKNFVEIISSSPRTVSLHVLTPAGMKHFRGQSRLTQSTTVHGIADILVLNAYAFELGEPDLFPYSTDRSWTIAGLRVGLVSTRYGLPKSPGSFDRLLILPNTLRNHTKLSDRLPFYIPLALKKTDFP